MLLRFLAHILILNLSFERSLLSVIPWLDHGIQLKILKLLVFFIAFMDPVVKPRGDS
ncbi:MAG: hypothetical protein ACEY3D_09090 [Rickettsia sp.]|uniref:hypothetical protein n=1 Tax=Rickettsia sp. TaxID=789 RepID=UPI00397CA4AD